MMLWGVACGPRLDRSANPDSTDCPWIEKRMRAAAEGL